MKTKEFINELLTSAISSKASDIFFFPKKETMVVQFRTNQGVITQTDLSLNEGQETISPSIRSSPPSSPGTRTTTG